MCELLTTFTDTDVVDIFCCFCCSLEDTENTEAAIKCYRDILVLVPEHSAAKQAIQSMTASQSHREGGDTTAEQEHVVSSTRCVCVRVCVYV